MPTREARSSPISDQGIWISGIGEASATKTDMREREYDPHGGALDGRTHFRYRMELTFESTAEQHHYTLKCLPESNLRQQIIELETQLLPAGCSWESRDTFGNRELLGVIEEPHAYFRVEVEGEAILPARGSEGEIAVRKSAGEVEADFSVSKSECADEYADAISEEETGASVWMIDGIELYPEEWVQKEKLGIYRYPTALTRPGERIRGYYEDLAHLETRTPLDENMDIRCEEHSAELQKDVTCRGETAGAEDRNRVTRQAQTALRLMHALHRDFRYQKAATNVSTTAEEAMERGAGVCQDYAHIFLSLLRLAGIPCRYVTGMLQGEGESHAWVEAALGEYWYGLDPTNDCAVAGSHVKIASGRDYSDCRISQGVFYGGGEQRQSIQVSVQTQSEQ